MKKTQAISSPQLNNLSPGAFFLDDEEIYQNCLFQDSDQSYLTCHNLVLRQCQLEKVILVKNRLERFEASNVLFDKCDLANTELLGASFHQVTFRHCKLTGTNFAESYLRDVIFEDCLLDYASFANTNLKSIAFSNCRLREAEFYDLTWKNLQLKQNDLHGTNWLHTSLTGLDFTTNTFEKIGLSAEQLKGLTVDPAQALVIGASLGLVIA